MLKKALMFLIPICIGSLIIAGVLQLILGDKIPQYPYNDEPIYTDSSSAENSVVFIPNKQYTVLNGESLSEEHVNVYGSLVFKFSGINAVITCTNDDIATVSVKNDDPLRGIQVYLSAEDNETTIEIHPSNISFATGNEYRIQWTDDPFSPYLKSTVIISIPDKEYNKLVLEQGSGVVNMTGIDAQSSDITVCSGRLSFIGNNYFLPEFIKLKTGSGKATFENVHAKNCELDIGSGSADISGLMGTGTAKIDGGTAAMSFDSFSYVDIDKADGTFSLVLPPQTSAGLHAELKAGTIDVNTDTTQTKITESGYYSVGSENSSNLIKVQNDSGDIFITNHPENIPENNPEENPEINSSDDYEQTGDYEINSSVGYETDAGYLS